MDTLTHEQAERLRRLRPKVRPILDAMCDLRDALAGACEHADESFPETCPLCSLYVLARDAAAEFHDLPDLLDKYLLDGPHPREKDRP